MWHDTFVINVFVVHSQVRRRGVGKLLLKTVKHLALQQRAKRLTVAVQTKNHPAIEFAQQQGFVFCGYNDRYYPNGDIALMYSLTL